MMSFAGYEYGGQYKTDDNVILEIDADGNRCVRFRPTSASETPKAIIDEYIVKEIERELSTTTHTVQEIANTFGFSSQAHLTKFFKKMRGVTPSAFRQKG